MSLIDAYAADEADALKSRECGMTRAREQLGDDGWKQLLELAARPNVEASRLARVLHGVDVRISTHTVQRHLAGRCKACAARGDFT